MTIQDAALAQVKHILTTELQERQINPIFVPVVNDYLAGRDIGDIAAAHGLDVMEVSLILEKPEIQNYCTQTIMSMGYLGRLKRVDLINKVVAKIVEDAEENEAPYSNKDLLDWVKVLQKEWEINKSKAPAPTVQVNQQNNTVNLIQELMD
jgi:hypothetical protein